MSSFLISLMIQRRCHWYAIIQQSPFHSLCTCHSVCGKFIHPEQIGCLYLLHQPHDSSMFDIFNAGKTMSWDILLQGRKTIKITGCQIKTICGQSRDSQLSFCSKFIFCCYTCSTASSRVRITPSLRPGCLLLMATCTLFNMMQCLLALTVHPCCKKSSRNTPNKSQNMMASTLTVDGITLNCFFLDEPGCFHSMVGCFLVSVKWWIYVLTSVTTQQRQLLPSTTKCYRKQGQAIILATLL